MSLPPKWCIVCNNYLGASEHCALCVISLELAASLGIEDAEEYANLHSEEA